MKIILSFIPAAILFMLSIVFFAVIGHGGGEYEGMEMAFLIGAAIATVLPVMAVSYCPMETLKEKSFAAFAE